MCDTEKLIKSVIEKEVDKQIAEQEEDLIADITQGIKETDSLEMACAQMVRNGFVIATKVCAVMAAKMLFDAGVWEPKPDNELVKSLLTVVDGGKSREQKED